MAYEQKDNSGTLFKNKSKETDTQPEYKGHVLIGGQEYWINAWVKTAQKGDHKGDKFFSLSFQPKGEQEFKASDFTPGTPPAPEDDLPF